MTGVDPAAVSVYDGPDAGFVDPWGPVTACGECGTRFAEPVCPGCGQRAITADTSFVVDPGLVQVMAGNDDGYDPGQAAVS